jgi:hypothetical protein
LKIKAARTGKHAIGIHFVLDISRPLTPQLKKVGRFLEELALFIDVREEKRKRGKAG